MFNTEELAYLFKVEQDVYYKRRCLLTPGPTEAKNLWGGHHYMDLQNFEGASPYFCIDFQKLWGGQWPPSPPSSGGPGKAGMTTAA